MLVNQKLDLCVLLVIYIAALLTVNKSLSKCCTKTWTWVVKSIANHWLLNFIYS